MSHQGVNTTYSYKVTDASGTDKYIGLGQVGTVLEVSNYSTTVAIGIHEAVTAEVPNAEVPTSPGSTSQVLEQRLFGLCTVSGARNYLGVALADCPVKDTTKPVGTYTIPVAGPGSIIAVRCLQSLTASTYSNTVGNTVDNSTSTGLMDSKTAVAGVGSSLGYVVKAQATVTSWKGARDASATTAYFVGCYVCPR